MGRHSLRIIIVLGVLVTFVGGTGIFAVFTDQATAGDNSVSSGTRPSAADLRIEAGQLAGGQISCDGDVDAILWDRDDITTGQFSASGIQPGADLGVQYVCLRNVGSAPLAVSASAIDLADIDTSCSGDEAAAGDTSCGGGLAGELSGLLLVDMDRVVCTSPAMPYIDNGPAPLSAMSPADLLGAGSQLSADEIMCVRVNVTYPSTTAESFAQRAQTDTVTWRFAFDATAS
jgi:hypothetical protein